jgi:hypothetical protein
MSGANAAYMAKQMGHSTEMFFKVYADRIDGADDDRGMAKSRLPYGNLSLKYPQRVKRLDQIAS